MPNADSGFVREVPLQEATDIISRLTNRREAHGAAYHVVKGYDPSAQHEIYVSIMPFGGAVILRAA